MEFGAQSHREDEEERKEEERKEEERKLALNLFSFLIPYIPLVFSVALCKILFLYSTHILRSVSLCKKSYLF